MLGRIKRLAKISVAYSAKKRARGRMVRCNGRNPIARPNKTAFKTGTRGACVEGEFLNIEAPHRGVLGLGSCPSRTNVPQRPLALQ